LIGKTFRVKGQLQEKNVLFMGGLESGLISSDEREEGFGEEWH
jgi:hypothetical protein